MYSVEEFFKTKLSNKEITIGNDKKHSETINECDNLKSLEQYDKIKSKVLKYVLYKKRTEQQVRQKFSAEVEQELLEDIIENLKQNSYIDDYKYIEKTIKEFTNLKALSIKEIKYKLYSKGIKTNLIENYIYENSETLQEYERESIYKIFNKKSINMDKEQIKNYLLKKGYIDENIKEVLLNM